MIQNDLYEIVESLPRGDPAWHLLDAFDAVTNGMENPELMKRAASVKNPALECWKPLVQAIAALYAGNETLCQNAAAAIPEGSPPAVFKPLFRAWLIRRGCFDSELAAAGRCVNREKELFQELTGCRESVVSLFQRLIIEPHPLSLLAEQAEEALRQGLEEMSANLAAKVLAALKEIDPLMAIRYGARCFALSSESGARPDALIAAVKKSLPDAEKLADFLGARAADAQPAPPKAPERGENTGAPRRTAKNSGRPRQRELFSPDEEISAAELSEKKAALPCREEAIREAGENLKLDPRRIEEALTPPASFDELARRLPPASRYLGPGVWIKAIKGACGVS
ncbi:MAG: hypothetical protein LBB82_10065 [Treponema sp.]|jgi:hypothetical protein|nr:hypothetical protein [Treponema sp.]